MLHYTYTACLVSNFTYPPRTLSSMVIQRKMPTRNTLPPWRCSQQVLSKCWQTSARVHGVTFQKNKFFLGTVPRTSCLIKQNTALPCQLCEPWNKVKSEKPSHKQDGCTSRRSQRQPEAKNRLTKCSSRYVTQLTRHHCSSKGRWNRMLQVRSLV
jgi:hypothetical protein